MLAASIPDVKGFSIMANLNVMHLLGFSGRSEAELRGYGTIRSGFFTYITPKMLLTIGGPIALVVVNLALVKEYFLAGEALNFIILAVFTVGVIKATYNNFVVRKNAKYIKRLGDMLDAGRPTAEDVRILLATLGTKGNLFDTNHMEGCISNIERFGHPNFTDSDARMIKSKLGQRLAETRKGVFFLGGLLVMLGLIGTYIGLLHTVDKVGQVMQRMSAIGDASGDALSGFLGALAEPLQGMGLAFSASLFGIAGSLLLQVYGNFCNHAQNEFVENVSRWIDDRIPKFSSADKDQKNKVFGRAASADDLRTWLAGFVNLSVQSNKKLGQLTSVMLRSSQASIKSSRAIDALLLSQKNTHGLVEAMSQSVVEFGRRTTDNGMNSQVMSDLVQSLNMMNAQSNASNNVIKESLIAIGQTMRSQSSDIAGLNNTLRVLPETMAQLAQTQQLLLQRLEGMQGAALPARPAAAAAPAIDGLGADMAGLGDLGDMGDINKMFADMENGSDAMFEEMFGIGEDEDEGPKAKRPVSEKEI